MFKALVSFDKPWNACLKNVLLTHLINNFNIQYQFVDFLRYLLYRNALPNHLLYLQVVYYCQSYTSSNVSKEKRNSANVRLEYHNLYTENQIRLVWPIRCQFVRKKSHTHFKNTNRWCYSNFFRISPNPYTDLIQELSARSTILLKLHHVSD